MESPPHWNIRERLSLQQRDALAAMILPTRQAFQDSVMRRLELNGFTVTGNVASAGPDRQINFLFSGPPEGMTEMEAPAHIDGDCLFSCDRRTTGWQPNGNFRSSR